MYAAGMRFIKCYAHKLRMAVSNVMVITIDHAAVGGKSQGQAAD